MGSGRPPFTDEQKEAMEAAFKEVAPIMRAERFEAGFRAGLAFAQRAGEPPTPGGLARALGLAEALAEPRSWAAAEGVLDGVRDVAAEIVTLLRAALASGQFQGLPPKETL